MTQILSQICFYPVFLLTREFFIVFFLQKHCPTQKKRVAPKAICIDIRIIQEKTESHTTLASQCACTLDCAQGHPGVLRTMSNPTTAFIKPLLRHGYRAWALDSTRLGFDNHMRSNRLS